jgi:hypothetical protein
MENKKPKTPRRKIIFRICIGVFIFLGVLLVCAWLIINRLLGEPYATPDVPRPLGDSSKLEYIGRTDSGCHGFCDSGPSTTYYYGTDMSLEEVTTSLLPKATLEGKPYQSSVFYSHLDTSATEYWITFKPVGSPAYRKATRY